MMSLHQGARIGVLLLAAMAAVDLTAQTTAAQTASPATPAPPSPDPSQTPAASASPAPTASDGQGEAVTLCDQATKASVIEYMGGGAPLSVTERDPSGALLEGCEVIFSSGTSIIVGIHDASDWEDTIASLDYEPVEGVEGMYYSDIIGLVWRPSGVDVYLSVRVPLHELIHHRQVLSLLLGDDG